MLSQHSISPCTPLTGFAVGLHGDKLKLDGNSPEIQLTAQLTAVAFGFKERFDTCTANLLNRARSVHQVERAFITACMLIYSVNCVNLQPAVHRVEDARRHADLASQDVPVLMLARSQSHAQQLIYLYRDRRASSPDGSVPHR